MFPDKRKELLRPINKYRNMLLEQIDAAEWRGDFDLADRWKQQLRYVEKEIKEGAVYYCLH